MIVVVAFTLGLFANIGLVFFLEYLENVKGKKEGDGWRYVGKEIKGDLNTIEKFVRQKIKRIKNAKATNK